MIKFSNLLKLLILVKKINLIQSFPISNGSPNQATLGIFSSPFYPSLITLVSVALVIASMAFLLSCVCCDRHLFKTKQHTLGPESPRSQSFSNFEHSSEFTIFPPNGASGLLSPASGGDQDKVVFEPLPEICPPSFDRRHDHPHRPAHFNSVFTQSINVTDWFEGSRDLQFPRDKLQFLKELGEGWFGQVVEAEVLNNPKSRHAVVKILRPDASPSEHLYFFHSLRFYRDLHHPHILQILGHCLESNPFLILLEYLPMDLKAFLRSHCRDRDLTEDLLLRLSCNLASALQCMHEQGFVHTDLAARNCLFNPSTFTLKLGDYGISLEKYKEDYYFMGDMGFPIRWSAPESLSCSSVLLETRELTKEANIWSFGIVLWELLEYGAMPYPDLSNEDVLQKVVLERQLLLGQPTSSFSSTEKMFQIMLMCWRPEPKRPPINKLNFLLHHLYTTINRESSVPASFEEKWDALQVQMGREYNLSCSIPESLSTVFRFESDFVPNSISCELDHIPTRDASHVSFNPKLSDSMKNLLPSTSLEEIGKESSIMTVLQDLDIILNESPLYPSNKQPEEPSFDPRLHLEPYVQSDPFAKNTVEKKLSQTPFETYDPNMFHGNGEVFHADEAFPPDSYIREQPFLENMPNNPDAAKVSNQEKNFLEQPCFNVKSTIQLEPEEPSLNRRHQDGTLFSEDGLKIVLDNRNLGQAGPSSKLQENCSNHSSKDEFNSHDETFLPFNPQTLNSTKEDDKNATYTISDDNLAMSHCEDNHLLPGEIIFDKNIASKVSHYDFSNLSCSRSFDFASAITNSEGISCSYEPDVVTSSIPEMEVFIANPLQDFNENGQGDTSEISQVHDILVDEDEMVGDYEDFIKQKLCLVHSENAASQSDDHFKSQNLEGNFNTHFNSCHSTPSIPDIVIERAAEESPFQDEEDEPFKAPSFVKSHPVKFVFKEEYEDNLKNKYEVPFPQILLSKSIDTPLPPIEEEEASCSPTFPMSPNAGKYYKSEEEDVNKQANNDENNSSFLSSLPKNKPSFKEIGCSKDENEVKTSTPLSSFSCLSAMPLLSNSDSSISSDTTSNLGFYSSAKVLSTSSSSFHTALDLSCERLDTDFADIYFEYKNLSNEKEEDTTIVAHVDEKPLEFSTGLQNQTTGLYSSSSSSSHADMDSFSENYHNVETSNHGESSDQSTSLNLACSEVDKNSLHQDSYLNPKSVADKSDLNVTSENNKSPECSASTSCFVDDSPNEASSIEDTRDLPLSGTVETSSFSLNFPSFESLEEKINNKSSQDCLNDEKINSILIEDSLSFLQKDDMVHSFEQYEKVLTENNIDSPPDQLKDYFLNNSLNSELFENEKEDFIIKKESELIYDKDKKHYSEDEKDEFDPLTGCPPHHVDLEDELLRIDTETNEAILLDSSECVVGFVPTHTTEEILNGSPALLKTLSILPGSTDSTESSDDHGTSLEEASSPMALGDGSNFNTPEKGAMDVENVVNGVEIKISPDVNFSPSFLNEKDKLTNIVFEGVEILAGEDCSMENKKKADIKAEAIILDLDSKEATPLKTSESPAPDSYSSDFESDTDDTSSTGTSDDVATTSESFEYLDKIEPSNKENQNSESHSFSKKWNSKLTPTKSALKSPEKKDAKVKKNVTFNENNEPEVFNYITESSSDDDTPKVNPWRRRELYSFEDWTMDDDIPEELVEADDDNEEEYLSYRYRSLPLHTFPSNFIYSLTGYSLEDLSESSDKGSLSDSLTSYSPDHKIKECWTSYPFSTFNAADFILPQMKLKEGEERSQPDVSSGAEDLEAANSEECSKGNEQSPLLPISDENSKESHGSSLPDNGNLSDNSQELGFEHVSLKDVISEELSPTISPSPSETSWEQISSLPTSAPTSADIIVKTDNLTSPSEEKIVIPNPDQHFPLLLPHK